MPISSQVSAPSKLPIVTSKVLSVLDLVQVLSLWNSSADLACVMMCLCSGVMVVCNDAKSRALSRRVLVIDG